MKKIQLQINPIDRVFFRKNVNFTSDEISISLIDSRVLPTPPTIVGAIRYTAANKMGWKGRGDWPNSIKEELGDRDNLGKLDFYGPHILHRNEEKATMNKNDNAKSILFKLPSHIIGKLPDENEGEDTAKISSLKPGPAVLSNLSSNQDDKIRLLTSSGDVDEFRSLENYYISNDDMLRVLKGEELNEIKLIPESSLISLEEQIGINLDYKNKSTSKDHSLFSRTFVRLGDDCSIFEEVRGLNDFGLNSKLIHLGGENRIAELVKLDENIPINYPSIELTDFTVEESRFNFYITFITPALIGSNYHEIKKLLEDAFKSTLEGASIGKTDRIGGWNSVDRTPNATYSHVSIGSTFFFSSQLEEKEKLMKMNATKIGQNVEWGYGQFLIGTW